MTINDAKQLQPGRIVHIDGEYNARGKCRNFRVNGQVRTWKRSPDRIRVPLKYGLYGYGAMTEDNVHSFHHEGECTS